MYCILLVLQIDQFTKNYSLFMILSLHDPYFDISQTLAVAIC